jgi:hypothetical protein
MEKSPALDCLGKLKYYLVIKNHLSFRDWFRRKKHVNTGRRAEVLRARHKTGIRTLTTDSLTESYIKHPQHVNL